MNWQKCNGLFDISALKYYVVFLDQFMHFIWAYPLHKKSDIFSKFFAFMQTHSKSISSWYPNFQCNNEGETTITFTTYATFTLFTFISLVHMLPNKVENPRNHMHLCHLLICMLLIEKTRSFKVKWVDCKM